MAKAKKKVAKKAVAKKLIGKKKTKAVKAGKANKSTKSVKAAKPTKPAKSAKPAKKAKSSKSKPLKKKTTQQVGTSNAQKPTSVKIVDISQFVTPLDDRVVIQISQRERLTPGGLIIPDTVSSSESYREGIVLSVGRGHRDPKGRLRPMDLKSGDKVLFSEYSGSKIHYQNAELMILRETDVMGVVS